jgi:hypothetical protein
LHTDVCKYPLTYDDGFGKTQAPVTKNIDPAESCGMLQACCQVNPEPEERLWNIDKIWDLSALSTVERSAEPARRTHFTTACLADWKMLTQVRMAKPRSKLHSVSLQASVYLQCSNSESNPNNSPPQK